MNVRRRTAIVVATWLTCAAPSVAYEVRTHNRLTRQSVDASVMGSPLTVERRQALGFPYLLDSERLKAPDSAGNPQTILALIARGAELEDNGLRVIHHFFNPTTGSPLTIDGSQYSFVTDGLLIPAIGVLNANARPSPDWALGTFSGPSIPNQAHSYRHFTNYLFESYTQPNNALRALATGAAFETLGRVLHHLQDMAQPQHVRNEHHWHDEGLESTCEVPPPIDETPLCRAYRKLSAPSGFEKWTDLLRALDRLPMAEYAPVYGGPRNDVVTFSEPRRFWVQGGKGIAEFTNSNFFGDRTMNVSPPTRGVPFDELASTLCQNAVPSCGAPLLADHYVRFWPSNVVDQFDTTAGGANPRAASESLFSYDFNRFVDSSRVVMSGNRFTYESSHAYLLPRAVAYSAGFINYTFRGEMQITPPAKGIYAIVDTTPVGCGSPCGFRSLRLHLRNTTANNEAMGPGTLTAVVKFRRNGCYRPDLAGHFGGREFLGNECRLGEEIVASHPLTVLEVEPVPRNAPGKEYPFQFAVDHPIPISATDVQLQVVFRGRLGQEEDAVAVTTLDIAEPNFVAVGNNTDYYFDVERNGWFPKTNPYVFSFVRVWFADPAVHPTPIAAIEPLNAAQHAQFAFLGDKTGVRYWLRDEVAGGGASYPDYENEEFPVQEFVLDESITPNTYWTNCPVGLWRGLYRQYVRMYATEHKRARASKAGGGVEETGLEVTTKLAPVTCGAAPTPGQGGFYDLSGLVPQFTPENASRWVINF